MTGFLRGSATAMITPFNENGVDLEAFGEMMEYQIAGGTHALIVLGTTGEPATMTEDEKEALIRYAVKKAAGRVKIVIGTGSNNTQKAVEGTIRAEKLGADGILAVTPYYNKCTQNGLVAYYKAIAEATKLPVICYNVPGRTGVNILPETMAKIAGIPNIAGIKEASGNMAQVLETARLIQQRVSSAASATSIRAKTPSICPSWRRGELRSSPSFPTSRPRASRNCATPSLQAI